MKICKKCGAENSNSRYICGECGESLSGAVHSDKVKMSEKIICPQCRMMNNSESKICQHCNSPISSSEKRVYVYDNMKENGESWSKSKIGVVLITYVIYVLLMVVPFVLPIIVILDIFIGWKMISDLDSNNFAFLSGISGWIEAGGSGCGGLVFAIILKFFVSFFVGLFFAPIKIGVAIHDKK